MTMYKVCRTYNWAYKTTFVIKVAYPKGIRRTTGKVTSPAISSGEVPWASKQNHENKLAMCRLPQGGISLNLV